MPPPDPRNAALDAYIQKIWRDSRNPSLAVRVVRGGSTVYETYLGYADIGRRAKPDPNTVYKVYSVTKVFTAAAVLLLHDRGVIDIRKGIRTYLPGLRFTYKGSPAEVTISHLLTHRSGIGQDLNSLGAHLESEPPPGLEKQMALLVKPELQCRPGEKSRYSNTNYLILGGLIETVTGGSYEGFLAENLLQPLGMTRSHFLARPEPDGNQATGYISSWSLYDFTWLLQHLADPFRDLHRAVFRDASGMKALKRFQIDGLPFGGLNSSMGDLARFARFSLDDSAATPLLTPESRRLLFTPAGRFGMGWFIDEEDGERRIFHRGSGPGFDAEICLIPSRDLAFIVLSNNVPNRHIGGLIVDKFLESVP